MGGAGGGRQLDGQVLWDFSIATFAADLYAGPGARARIALEATAVALLAAATAAHLLAALRAARAFALPQHLAAPGRWMRWGQLALMWYAWWVWWGRLHPAGRAFAPDAGGYPVLADPVAAARPFRTDAAAEERYLELVDRVRDLAGAAAHYHAVAGLCAFLLVGTESGGGRRPLRPTYPLYPTYPIYPDLS